MTVNWKSSLVAMFALMLVGVAASAQTATATLSGTVRDEAGAVVAGASVTLRNPLTGASRSVKTDDEGRYSLTNIEPGEYELRAERSGFKTEVQSGVVLAVGGATVADISMGVGQVTEEVLVPQREMLIEPTKVEVSRVVASVEIESLPISGRNFVDFVKLSSGVAPGRENVGGGPFKEPDTGIGSAAAPRLTFAGQSELNTLIQVDGADNIQTFTGLPRATPSQEAVSEFRVLNSTYLAEYGRALGGFVNIVTKSGTNQTHGSLYYFGMNDELNGKPILSGNDPVLRQNQYGATLGGPIKKDRTFFFSNYEGQRRAESNKFSDVIRNNLASINALKRRFNLTPETTDLLRANDYDEFLLKLDHRTGNNNLSFRYNFINSETHGFLGGGGRGSPASTTARNNLTRDQALVANYVGVFSEKTVNELRFQYARRTYDFPSVLNEPDLEISNLILTGKSTSDVDFYRETRAQIVDNLTHVKGAHQISVGADVNFLRDNTKWNLFFPARIVFPPSLAAFFSGSPVLFWWPVLSTATSHPGFNTSWNNAVPPEWEDATLQSLNHSSYGVFAEDRWKVNQKLTLTYGLRYDIESYPSKFIRSRDLSNFQPRVGAAYAYSSKSVIRAGFGIFNDRLAPSIGQVFTASEWSSRGNSPNAARLFPDVAPIPGRFLQNTVGGPAAVASALTFLTTGHLPASGATNLTDNISGKLRNPYSEQASLQISREIGGGVLVTASYLYLHALNLLGHTANLNTVQTGVLPTGKPLIAGRLFPELGNFHVTTNLGYSIYHGGTLEIEKQLSRGVGFHGSYTWSKTIGNVDSVTNLGDFPDGLDANLERAISRQDVGHRFTLTFLSQIPRDVPVLRGFKFSSLVALESGRHFNVSAGSDANGDGNPLSDRPGLLGRNSLKGPMFASVDLRVARTIPFNERIKGEITVDMFNLFNRVNIKDLNTVYGGIDLSLAPNPLLGFNTPRDAFNPFLLQFGFKLRY